MKYSQVMRIFRLPASGTTGCGVRNSVAMADDVC